MNEWLATVYGTNGASDDQFQKTAQAQMLAKLAEEEGWDLSGLSEEELQMIANELENQGPDAQQAAAPAEGVGGEGGVGGEEAEKIAAAKFAEADFLGRTMAHSYIQELQKIAESMEKKCEKCGKAECECPPEKTAGPLTRAIQSLQGPEQSDVDLEKQARAFLESRGYRFE